MESQHVSTRQVTEATRTYTLEFDTTTQLTIPATAHQFTSKEFLYQFFALSDGQWWCAPWALADDYGHDADDGIWFTFTAPFAGRVVLTSLDSGSTETVPGTQYMRGRSPHATESPEFSRLSPTHVAY